MLRAFTGTPVSKTECLKAITRHAENDRLIRGTYWDDDLMQGCGVGCTLVDFVDDARKCADHEWYEWLFGIPMYLARLEDRIFENVSPARRRRWPVEFIAAIPVGSDLGTVAPDIYRRILADAGLRRCLEVAKDVGLWSPADDRFWNPLGGGIAVQMAIDGALGGMVAGGMDWHSVHERVADIILEGLRAAPVPGEA